MTYWCRGSDCHCLQWWDFFLGKNLIVRMWNFYVILDLIFILKKSIFCPKLLHPWGSDTKQSWKNVISITIENKYCMYCEWMNVIWDIATSLKSTELFWFLKYFCYDSKINFHLLFHVKNMVIKMIYWWIEKYKILVAIFS